MKLVNEWITQELTFQYNNEIEKKLHEETMFSEGFTVAPKHPVFMQKTLMVTYQKRKQNDNISRL